MEFLHVRFLFVPGFIASMNACCDGNENLLHYISLGTCTSRIIIDLKVICQGKRQIVTAECNSTSRKSLLCRENLSRQQRLVLAIAFPNEELLQSSYVHYMSKRKRRLRTAKLKYFLV